MPAGPRSPVATCPRAGVSQSYVYRLKGGLTILLSLLATRQELLRPAAHLARPWGQCQREAEACPSAGRRADPHRIWGHTSLWGPDPPAYLQAEFLHPTCQRMAKPVWGAASWPIRPLSRELTSCLPICTVTLAQASAM